LEQEATEGALRLPTTGVEGRRIGPDQFDLRSAPERFKRRRVEVGGGQQVDEHPFEPGRVVRPERSVDGDRAPVASDRVGRDRLLERFRESRPGGDPAGGGVLHDGRARGGKLGDGR